MWPKLWPSVLFYIVSVHVKTDLPHTVARHERTHTFTVWAEDSCYNRVTGTVTITTYNVVSYHRNALTVWAEDSCYNRVTGTVTITTYNVVSYHRNALTVWAQDSCYHRVTGTVTITTYNVVSFHRNTYLLSGLKIPAITGLLELLP